MMQLGERREIKPLLVKFGVAFIFVAGGVFVTRLRRKGIKPSLPSSPKLFSDSGKEFELGGRTKHKDNIWSLKSVPSSGNIVSVASPRYEESCSQKVIVENSAVSSGVNEIVKEVDFGGSTNNGCSTWKDVEIPTSKVEPSRACRGLEKDDIEQEVRNLKNMVTLLQEREKNLELQLLDYYGLKEQEAAVLELQNRLKLNNIEGKLLNLKIESLHEDNRRLQAQVADHAKIVSELETAKIKIKLLKKKLWNEAQRNREQILVVQKRVSQLQEQAHKGATIDPDIQSRLQRLKALEVEVVDLRKSNMMLQQENSELARKLESIQMLTISAMEDPETEALREMSRQLKEQNENLSKEVDKLHADKCTGVEELVYLKWINACLRYELRNYQPPAGKTVARDLCKTLSPKSEEKTKQLILEYAQTEGHGNMMDIDSDRWSTSHASSITDSENNQIDSSAEKSFSGKNSSSKRNLFDKLRKLVLGKDVSPLKRSLSDDKMGSSLEDGNSPWQSSGTSTVMNAFSPQSSSTPFLEIQSLRSVNEDDTKNMTGTRSISDLGSSYTYKGFSDYEKQPDQDADLLKFAEALKSTHDEGGRTHRRFRSADC